MQVRKLSLCLLYLCILTLTLNYGLAQPINLATIEGHVIEDLTGDPIKNATVTVWTEQGILQSTTETDSNGYFKIEIEGDLQCRVYAYYDDQNTNGFDYVPAFQSFYLRPTYIIRMWAKGWMYGFSATRTALTYLLRAIKPKRYIP